MAGLKAMTATSGPGLSLFSEHISFAIGSEIPLVIVDVQRLGPSTGSATKGADSDIQFMRWGSSGGQPVIVLCPMDVRDCLVLTVQAFNLAEAFRCPVFLASNKEIGLTKESIDLSGLALPAVRERARPEPGQGYLPFRTRPGQDVPLFLPIGGQTALVRQTSSTHGQDGYITTDPEAIAAMQERRRRKVEAQVEEMAFAELRGEPEAEAVIITYGVTARAALAALAVLQRQGRSVSVLILRTLWPVLEGRIREACTRAGLVVVAEMNQGQYAREVQRILPDRSVRGLGRMDGDLLTPTEITEAVHD
jgi:2-oxoglutarate ferredoxin oxidoreductase subunit alpha